MKFRVAHANGLESHCIDMDLPEPITIAQAISASPLLMLYPYLDLNTHRVGVYGKSCPLTTPVKEGDRVEIYLPAKRREVDDEQDDD
jgi:putative ubiquitin-RnfH superfamily antitoxin RatB of RatAB toxin-antitoxin module